MEFPTISYRTVYILYKEISSRYGDEVHSIHATEKGCIEEREKPENQKHTMWYEEREVKP